MGLQCIWGFPKIGGTFLGVPIIRIIVFWGLYWGPLILGNYHLFFRCLLGCFEGPLTEWSFLQWFARAIRDICFGYLSGGSISRYGSGLPLRFTVALQDRNRVRSCTPSAEARSKLPEGSSTQVMGFRVPTRNLKAFGTLKPQYLGDYFHPQRDTRPCKA